MMSVTCSGCQIPFPDFSTFTSLLCATEVEHLRAKVRHWADQAGCLFNDSAGCIVLHVERGTAKQRLQELVHLHSPLERSALRVALLSEPVEDVSSMVQAVFRARSLEEWAGILSQEWLGDLLKENRLTSYFQPVMWASDRDIFGYEALLRGLTETGEVLSAFALLDAARASNALFALDQRARSSSIHCAARAGIGEKKLLINFLPSIIYDPAVCLGTTLRAMKETGIRPDQIIFEVVETEQVADSEFLRSVLKHYRDMGFGIALDDLGTGHSSLLLLAELHPDYAKLDMRMVSAAMHNRLTDRLMDSVCAAARSEGIRIIAEGIETEEVFVYCREKGIDLVQGYHLGRPAPQLLTPALTSISS